MERVTKLTEIKREFWHNVLPLGSFFDMRYGKVEITSEMIQQMVENFKQGIPHYRPPVNLSHKDEFGGYGTVEELEARTDGLWARIVLTDEGVRLLEEGKFKYVSAEFVENYVDKQTGENVGYVFVGLALTNKPAHPKVKPITFAERFKEALRNLLKVFEDAPLQEEDKANADVEFADVPNWKLDADSPWDWDWTDDANAIIEKYGWKGLAQACAYVDMENFEKGESGYPETKEAYKLPFAKLKNGEMVIYRRGVIAGMQALLGARGGVNIPRDERKKVYEKLAELYRRFDMEPPEFHFSEEVFRMELEEKAKMLEDKVKELSETNAELVKKLDEAMQQKAELERKLTAMQVEAWSRDWIGKGVAPAVMGKFKKFAEESPERMKEFDEVLETLADSTKLRQLGEENKEKNDLERADKIAKIVFGGEKV